MFKLVVLSSLLVVACSAILPLGPVSEIAQAPIVGGDLAVIGDAPWQVALQYDSILYCGGSIISPTIILTAGHCSEETTPGRWRVRAGSSFHASGGEIYNVSKVVTHPSYSETTFDYDVGVLILSSPISIDNVNVRIATLPSRGDDVAAGASALVTGWGSTSSGGPISDQLRKVTLPVVDQTACISAYQGFNNVTPRMVCGGLLEEGGKDVCQGDSGGPFIVNGFLVGVASWGRGCGVAGSPGVWARVSALVDWINVQM